MRKKPKTIILAKVRVELRSLARLKDFDDWEFEFQDKRVKKIAERIWRIFKK